MRIGMIAPPWVPTPPISYGGTEQIVDLLARGVVAAGHEVVLFATGDSTCPVHRRWVFERPPEPMGETVPETHHLVEAYRQLADVDVIHDHTTLGPLLGRLLRPETPIVATNHGPFTVAANSIYRCVSDDIGLVAISLAHGRSAGPGVRVAAVIPHGIEVETIPIGAGDGGYVLFLGRMAADKGAHRAIDAARAAGVPIKLAAKCREAAEVEYFDTEIEPRLGAGVEYLGEIGAAEKFRILGGATALLNPIAWPEPFGLVMIESLACGTPVIATPFGAAPEIVTDGVTGWLCSGHDDLVRALEEIGRIDRGACRSAAVRDHSAQRMVNAHLELYAANKQAGGRSRH